MSLFFLKGRLCKWLTDLYVVSNDYFVVEWLRTQLFPELEKQVKFTVTSYSL